MDNYYKILQLSMSAENDEIIQAYKQKIKPYKKFTYLNKQQKKEVKLLKEALYVLTNKELRNIYNFNLQKESFKTLNNLDDLKYKKQKVDGTLISDRMFSLASLMLPPKPINGLSLASENTRDYNDD